MTARAIDPAASPTDVARGAEDFALDRAHARGVVSFNGDDEVAGLWVISLE